MSFKILGTGSYAPEHVVTNDDLSALVDTNDEWITQRIGVRSRHISETETNVDMAVKAAERALENAGISADELDLIIATTITGDTLSPGTGCMVQNRIGAHCPAFDLAAACSGFLFALETAAGFLSRGAYNRVLVVSAERMSGIIDWTDRGTCCIFGDGAGAAVLGKGDGLVASHLMTKGGDDVITIPTRYDRSPLISDKETGTWRTFTDIQGVEDFHGEMDFKVAGTTEGVTAIQMDLKNDGLTMEIIADALERCRKARLEILNEIMIPCIAKPRDHVSEYAPKMLTMKIDVDKIREVIGKGGSMIQKIVAESGAQVDIDDDGTIHIASPDAASCDAAKKMIDDICFVPEVGKLYYGKVVRILPIGAFVELAPGKDGMIHISKLENRRVEKVEDVLNIGDMTWVKVTEIDEKGRVNLSRKDALKELAAAADKK